MKKLTETQKRVLEFLRTYIKNHGYPPTIREIGNHFGFLWPAARRHLQSLEKKGFLHMRPGISRGIELIGIGPSDSRSIPVAGKVRAGEPDLVIEEIDTHILVDPSLFPQEGTFSLRVTGESMKEAGILHGDFVIVKPQSTVEHGEIGVILIGEEVTVKRVLFKDGTIILKPENRYMKPVAYEPEKIAIIGKVIGLIRSRI